MIDNETIAKTIGEGPIGQELDKTDPQYKKFGGRKCHIVDVYPDYANSEKDALRVLAWLNTKAHSFCTFDLFFAAKYKLWVAMYAEYENGFYAVMQRCEAATAPAAIIAAFEWFVKEREK